MDWYLCPLASPLFPTVTGREALSNLKSFLPPCFTVQSLPPARRAYPIPLLRNLQTLMLILIYPASYKRAQAALILITNQQTLFSSLATPSSPPPFTYLLYFTVKHLERVVWCSHSLYFFTSQSLIASSDMAPTTVTQIKPSSLRSPNPLGIFWASTYFNA